jgi:ribosomal-protein-alanine N-acetyltransferase
MNASSAQAFETERLVCVPLRAEHAGQMFAGLQDSALYEYIGDVPPESMSALERRYSTLSAGAPNNEEVWLNWIVQLRPARQACGYVQATVKGDRALIAYVVFRQYWRRGIAAEAVHGMLGELERAFGVRSASATVDPRNGRSVNLLIKLGFEFREKRRGAEWIKGVLTDEDVYQRSLGMR